MIGENLNFRIGDIGLRLSGSAGWEYSRKGKFELFLSSESSQASYQVNINLSEIRPNGKLVFKTEQGWRLLQDMNCYVIWVPSSKESPYLAGKFPLDFHSGDIYISESDQEPGKYVFPLSYPLGELLMINLLGTGYGIMVHSCGVIDGEGGIVFAGIGSAGKSTTARLWDGLNNVRVVNDDHTIIRKIDGQFRMYGTPWHGQGGIARPDDAALKEIFILKQAPANQAVRLSPARAAAELLVRTFAPLWSAPAMNFTLQFLDELCQTVPCYEFGFVPDKSAVEYVRCLPSK